MRYKSIRSSTSKNTLDISMGYMVMGVRHGWSGECSAVIVVKVVRSSIVE